MDDFDVAIAIQLRWSSRIETGSPQLNRLIETIATNATLLARASELIRTVRELLNEASASGHTGRLAQFAADMTLDTEQLAHAIAAPERIH